MGCRYPDSWAETAPAGRGREVGVLNLKLRLDIPTARRSG
jgi:hypothetical protein